MFPQKNWRGKPVGWFKYGEHEGELAEDKKGVQGLWFPIHGGKKDFTCTGILHHGEENNKRFLFCPYCMIKVEVPNALVKTQKP